MPEAEKPCTVLAFDFGLRQIGLAVGQTLTGSASPLQVIKAREGIPDWDLIGALLKEWRPHLLLVGLPLNMDGTESELSVRARKFARRLKGRFGQKVLLVDERLTTREAKSRSGPRDSYRDSPIDDLAAQIILESWLQNPQESLDA